MTTAFVRLWGKRVGAVLLDGPGEVATFEYDRDFVAGGIEVSPLEMPLSANRLYRFPGLAREAFSGLPGLLADSLPDRFGNRLIDEYLAANGMSRAEFDSVQRLCYVGDRGIGALEFEPASGPGADADTDVDVAALRELAADVLADRAKWTADMTSVGAIAEILQVGTSAGGARPKAVVAWNPQTDQIRTGQADAPAGFEHWILKFDGVSERGREVGSSAGYGQVEYAYSLMAAEAGIEMSTCRLYDEGGRHHFMTKRFDRLGTADKLHMQSLAGLCHFDFNDPRAYSYEQAFLAITQLGLGGDAHEQQFRRMLFNVIARNQDDHVKNIALLMSPDGRWSLSPAFDLTWSFNPQGRFTSTHQMSINRKRDNFTLEDFRACSENALLRRGRWSDVLAEVQIAVSRWPEFAAQAGVPDDRAEAIGATHRREFAKG